MTGGFLKKSGSGFCMSVRRKRRNWRFYEDRLLPLYKLYCLETVLEEVMREKVWLKSGGFLVIQQTEALSIDVNSGKYTGKKRRRRLTGRSIWRPRPRSADSFVCGIFPVSFSLTLSTWKILTTDELFHVLQKYFAP